ncbi:MAG: hypothetical protein HY293_04910 [Planctomycetes bacterium]|nr:hypothetical protein [Planctomycetota bacterium]
MFSDRLWILKAAAALGLFALVCTVSHQKLSALHPEIERVALYSPDLRRLDIHLVGKKVRASDDQGFEIDTKVGPMRVLSAARPPVGEHVSVVARAVGPRTLEAIALQVNAGYLWKRRLNYAISILTLVVYVALVSRRFRWRIAEGVFRSKY